MNINETVPSHRIRVSWIITRHCRLIVEFRIRITSIVCCSVLWPFKEPSPWQHTFTKTKKKILRFPGHTQSQQTFEQSRKTSCVNVIKHIFYLFIKHLLFWLFKVRSWWSSWVYHWSLVVKIKIMHIRQSVTMVTEMIRCCAAVMNQIHKDTMLTQLWSDLLNERFAFAVLAPAVYTFFSIRNISYIVS